MQLRAKILWYGRNFLNLMIALTRISFYFLRHPRRVSQLFFSFFLTINEFYQYSHGHLYSFKSTKIYQELKDHLIFAQCNFFNADPKVARPMETQILASLVSYLRPKTIFEIGTYNGLTALHFACNTPPEAAIYTLDLPAGFGKELQNRKQFSHYSYDDFLVVQLSMKNVHNRIFQNHPLQKKIIELFGDSKNFDFSPYHKKIDLVYIDGNHSYEYVKSDTENAFRMLCDCGVIIWHDFDYIVHRDVFRYLNQLVATRRIYSIPNTRFAIYGPAL